MAKYLDERITVEFDSLTAEKVYNYFVYYNPEDAEKETIFAGNLYAESTAKTLDITDIVQNDITKRGYGQAFQYSVEIGNKVKEVLVYHIYRYPHRLAKYLYRVRDYYTDCKAVDEFPILPPTYPATYTENLQKEQYFTSNLTYFIPEQISSNGIFGIVGNTVVFSNDINVSDSIYDWAIKDLTDNGLSVTIQTPYKPTNMSSIITHSGGEADEISEEISSFPYEYTAEGDTEQGNYLDTSYLIDFYFGDEDDDSRFNLYPYPFLIDSDSIIAKRKENLSFAINYKANTLSTDKIWKAPTLQYFTKTNNKIISQNSLYEELVDADYYVIALRDMDGDVWKSDNISVYDGSLEIPIWDGTNEYDDYGVDFKNFKGFTARWYDKNGAELGEEEVDLDLSQCQGDVVTLSIKAYKDDTPEYYLTCEVTDDFYNATAVFKYTTDLMRVQQDIYNNMTYKLYKQTRQKAGYKIINNIWNAYPDTSSDADMLIYYFDEEGTTSTAYLKTIQLIVMSDNTILHNKIYNMQKKMLNSLYIQDLNGKIVNNFRAIIYGIKDDNTVSYVDFTIPGYVCTSPHLYIYNRISTAPDNIQVRFFLNGYTTYLHAVSQVYTLDSVNFTNPILTTTCPKGYFLQWRDRWGSLQCQPFNKVNEYSEDIEASEITNYYGKRSIYKTENQPTFKINSGWIDTDVYPVYEGIFVSPTLKLYDADTDTSYDVILKDRSYTEKTFENQQHQMFNLTLNLELSSKQTILY
jgi:hypothetical protein